MKFALYSDGIDAPRDLQRAVKKALDAGLTREQALRALTLTPAEIYGIADRVGSIEKGKIANLVVTRGDIFETSTQVEMIIVDGRKYAPAADPADGRTRRRDGRSGRQSLMKSLILIAALAAVGAPVRATSYRHPERHHHDRHPWDGQRARSSSRTARSPKSARR